MKNLDFEAIYEEHFHTIYKYIRLMVSHAQLAEDLTQETFVRLLKGNFRNEAHIQTFIRQIARNLVIDHYRKKALIQWLPFTQEHEQHDFTYTPHDWLAQNELRQELYEALQQLKPLQREILIFRKIEELSIEETSLITGLSITKIANTQRSAMKKLQQLLGGEWHESP
ncbi:RNA polymerase sigma factor [Metasolibacillus meyeri]|uniref:RNA polymerase sigma factor n=1 Tax=Metasolibacillus meyeri TaxID=1071052 RepID=UPI001EE69DB7|nr:RNA polymerase sigma factor [Metasolibacillus meyeri]